MNEGKIIYFNCYVCKIPITKDNLEGSYGLKYCYECKRIYFTSLIENKISGADQNILGYMKSFFNSDTSKHYGWTEKECNEFINLIDRRGGDIPLRTILTMGKEL